MELSGNRPYRNESVIDKYLHICVMIRNDSALGDCKAINDICVVRLIMWMFTFQKLRFLDSVLL